jgi:hypothetical protein
MMARYLVELLDEGLPYVQRVQVDVGLRSRAIFGVDEVPSRDEPKRCHAVHGRGVLVRHVAPLLLVSLRRLSQRSAKHTSHVHRFHPQAAKPITHRA